MQDCCCGNFVCGNNAPDEHLSTRKIIMSQEGLSEDFTDSSAPVRIARVEHQEKIGFHEHDFYEFVLINSGFSMHICEGVTTILTGGDLFLMRPGESHSYINTHNVKLYNILFFEGFLGEDLERIKRLPGMDAVFGSAKAPFGKLHLSLMEKQELITLLENEIWETINRVPGWELRVKSLMIDFLVTYSRISSNKKKTGNDSSANFTQVSRALQYIENNYTDDISVKDMAKAAGISPDYMSKQFKSIVGIGPAEYCRNFRMAKAMEMLRVTENSVADIASQLGFDEVSVFSRQFKQIVGVSPTAFRAG